MFQTGYYALGNYATPYYMRGAEEETGATVGLGYHAERKRRKGRDDRDLITIVTAFLQIMDE